MILPSPQRTVRPVVFRPTAKSFPRFFFAPRSVKRDRSPHLAHPLPLSPRPFLLFCGIDSHFIFIYRHFRHFSARFLSTLPHFVRICFHEFARFSPQSRPVSPLFSGVSFPSVPPPSRSLRFLPSNMGFLPHFCIICSCFRARSRFLFPTLFHLSISLFPSRPARSSFSRKALYF